MNNVEIEILGLSVRSNNALKRAGIFTVADLLKLTRDDLYNINNIGAKSVEEIIDVIDKINSGELDVLSVAASESSDYPSLPLCDEDYIVAHSHNSKGLKPENVLYYQNGMVVEDISIDEMGFSVRSINALKRNGCFYLSGVCELRLKDLIAFKNLGRKSIDEIIEKLGEFTKPGTSGSIDTSIHKSNCVTYLLSKFSADEFNNEKGAIKSNLVRVLSVIENFEEIEENPENFDRVLVGYLMKDEYFVSLLKAHIITFVKNNEFTSIDTVKQNYDSSFSSVIVGFIDELHADKTLALQGDLYCFQYPSVTLLIENCLNETEADIIKKRLLGKTLEQIGDESSVTRERIRQKEVKALKKLPRCDEDKYQRLFETYYISKEDFCNYFDRNKYVYNYLSIRYQIGSGKIDDLIEDASFPKAYRFAAERAVYKNYALLGSKYVRKSRADLFDYVIFEFAQDSIKYDDLVGLYYDLLKDLELDKTDKFTLTRGYENKLAASRHALWTYPKTVRYYNIDSYDYGELLDALDLAQYNNVEYSTAKFYKEHSELMQAYDIRDEYELHNLLKKICDSADYPNIKFSKMPSIEFGVVDREEQIYSLLVELAPIGYNDFAQAYEERFGVSANTVIANYFKYVSQYVQNGVFELNLPELSGEEITFFREALKEDIYTLNSVKKMYLSQFPGGDILKLNNSSFKLLGYNMYSNYIISDKYGSSKEYFIAYLTKADLFSLEGLPYEIYWSQSLWGAINDIESDFDIIEYQPKKFINIKRIENLIGMTKGDLYDYCKLAVEAAGNDYFTVGSLRYYGFEHKIDDLGLEEYFYSSLLAQNKQLKMLRTTGNNRIFRKTGESFTLTDFFEWYIYSKDSLSVEIDDLIYELKHTYHLSFERHKILEVVRNSKLYYNSITDKVYADYDVYFDEI